jgi:predicted peroxiredoxin
MKSTNQPCQNEVLMTKTVNYSPEMVSKMRDLAPLNLEKAKTLAPVLERSVRSIIAKAKREGIEYVSVKPVAKRVKGLTKADLVKAISTKVGADLEGLEKAPAVTLGKLLECL